MIRIAITPVAYAAIAATLTLSSASHAAGAVASNFPSTARAG
jgi:hypothetical protein